MHAEIERDVVLYPATSSDFHNTIGGTVEVVNVIVANFG
jgi:hypothetical protein